MPKIRSVGRFSSVCWLLLVPSMLWASASSFNGSTSVLVITHSSAIGGTTWSVGCWMRRSGTGQTSFDTIISKGQGAGTGWEIKDFQGNTVTYIRAQWSGTAGEWTVPRLVLDTWTHLIVTYNGATTAAPIIYSNGLSVTVDTMTTPVGSYVPGIQDLSFGNDAGGGAAFLGQLGQCTYHDRVLTAAEARTLSCRGADCGARMVRNGIIGQWPMGVFAPRNYTKTGGLVGTATALSVFTAGPPVAYASQGESP